MNQEPSESTPFLKKLKNNNNNDDNNVRKVKSIDEELCHCCNKAVAKYYCRNCGREYCSHYCQLKSFTCEMWCPLLYGPKLVKSLFS